jgi:hypothetical protein
MAKKKKPIEELDLEEAINVVKRLSKPDRPNEEHELLKKASSSLLNEIQPGFEFEDDEEGESTVSEDLTKPPGFLEQLGNQAATLGPAGLIALGSAAYFQVDTVVEETRIVQQVAEEKWEEVKLEHPNINWDDPLAGFTTILGMGDIEIDLDPPTQPESKGTNETTTISKGTEPDGEETPETENSKESTKTSTESNTKDEDSNEEDVEEEKEEPKKKKKGFFSKLLGGDEEEKAEEPEEESEPESENKESEEESNEPEPEAEEQVEEKPKKKKGFFSFLTGGGDDNEEPDSEEGEPTQDGDTVPDEQTEEESTEESKTETSETEVDGGKQAGNPEANADTAESNGVKKSGGGGLLSLFGINTNEEEVVKQGDISADEEPVIEIAEVESETETPPISTDTEVEVEDISIDGIDDIKPHAMVTEIEVEAVEIDISDMVTNAEVIVDDILIDPGIEITAIDDVIEQVITPDEGTIIVSPSNQLYASN